MNKRTIAASLHCSSLPDYTPKSSFVFKVVDKQAFLSVETEDSGLEPSYYYIWAFWIPLCAPIKRAYFNLGTRLSGPSGQRWHISNEEDLDGAVQHITPYLLKWRMDYEQEQCRIDQSKALALTSGDLYAYQAWIYSLLWSNKVDEALPALDAVLVSPGYRKSWQLDILSDFSNLRTMISDGVKLRDYLRNNLTKSRRILGIGTVPQ